MMPALPGKAFAKQLPFINNDDGIFEVEFVEERRRGLEVNFFLILISKQHIPQEFINKVAGHPLVQGERCLHMFLTEAELDKANYVPGNEQTGVKRHKYSVIIIKLHVLGRYIFINF